MLFICHFKLKSLRYNSDALRLDLEIYNLLYHTEVLIRMYFLNVLTNQNKRYVITQINIEKFLGLCVEYSFTSLLKNIQLYMNVEGFYVETTQVYLGRL